MQSIALDTDRAAMQDHVHAIQLMASDKHRRIVVSMPEMATLDPDGNGPYDQFAMETIKEVQQRGVVKVAFDRAGSTTARPEDAPLFATGDPEKIKQTFWFYGYVTALKRCISLESQHFGGLLELICITGGPITRVEAREMPRIVADAIHDAELANVVIECEFKITQMSYYEFDLQYNITSEGQVGGVPSQRVAAAASSGGPLSGVALSTEARDDVDEELVVGQLVSRPASPSRKPEPEPEPEMPIGGSE